MLGWLIGWVYGWTIKPSMWVLVAGTVWHGLKRWAGRTLARQIVKPSGWFGRRLLPHVIEDTYADLNAWVVRQVVEVRPGDSVLDAACGPGVALGPVLESLSDNGQQASGSLDAVDWSQDALDAALERLGPERAALVTVHLADVLGLPFAASTRFHVVLALNIVHLFKDLNALLVALKSRVSSRGRLALSFIESEELLRESHVQSGVLMGSYAVRATNAVAEAAQAHFKYVRQVRHPDLPYVVLLCSMEPLELQTERAK